MRTPSTHSSGRVLRHERSVNWRSRETQPDPSEDWRARNPSTHSSGRVLRHVASLNWRNAQNQPAASEDQASQSGGLPESSSSTGLAQGHCQGEELKSSQVQEQQGQALGDQTKSPSPTVGSVQSPGGASGAASGTDAALPARPLTHSQSFLLTEPTAQLPVSPTDSPSAQPQAHPDPRGVHDDDASSIAHPRPIHPLNVRRWDEEVVEDDAEQNDINRDVSGLTHPSGPHDDDALFQQMFPPNTSQEIAQDDARWNDIIRDVGTLTPSDNPFQSQLDKVDYLRGLFSEARGK